MARTSFDAKADLDKIRQESVGRQLTETENKKMAALLAEIKDLESKAPKLTAEEQARLDRWATIDKTPKEKVFAYPFEGITPGAYVYHAGKPQHNLSAVIETSRKGLIVKLNGQATGQPLSTIPKYGVFIPTATT